MRCFPFGLVLASVVLFAGVAAGQGAQLGQATPPKPSFVRSAPIPPANAQPRAAIVMQISQSGITLQPLPKNHPSVPALTFQLAEMYAALASSARRDEIDAQTRGQWLRASGNDAAAVQQRVLELQAQTVVRAARKKAIELYTVVVNEHPTFIQISLVLMRLAQEYEDANDWKNARLVYYDLLKRNPASPYVPRAYLAFGELFFVEAETDPSKWDLAAQAYAEVTKYPAPTNSFYGYAWYKLAFVHWNKGERTKARNAFKQAIDFGAAYPQLPGATALADAARTDSAALPP